MLHFFYNQTYHLTRNHHEEECNFADGTEGELVLGRESHFTHIHVAPASGVTISADFMALRRLSGVIERLPREELHQFRRWFIPSVTLPAYSRPGL